MLTIDEVKNLAAWARKAHARGKHAVILVDGYELQPFAADLRRGFTGEYIDASLVEFIVDGKWWVMVRPVIDPMPTRLLKDPTVAVCVVRAESDRE